MWHKYPITLCSTLALLGSAAVEAKSENALVRNIPYKYGDPVPVTCLNRTIETGEHVTDSSGNLQFIPFPECAQTKRPLALPFMKPGPVNCTITTTDPLFHLLEFYIHNDAPLTCRLPVYRSTSAANVKQADDEGGEDARYVHMLVGLEGLLQRSHLHLGHEINAVVHTGTGRGKEGKMGLGSIVTASAYSSNARERNVKVVIGDDIPFGFDVRWVVGEGLPKSFGSSSGGGGMGTLIFGILVGFAVCFAWIKKWNVTSMWESVQDGIGGRKEVLPKYNGYGYGVGQAPLNGIGKRE